MKAPTTDQDRVPRTTPERIVSAPPPMAASGLPPRPASPRAGLLAMGAALLLAGVLYVFSPEQYAFYPRCLFFKLTGWQCPGCGGLRAAHQLLHGHLIGAWQHNPLAVLLAPLALAWLTLNCFSRRRALTGWLAQPRWIWWLLAVALAFTALRNLIDR